MGDTRPNGSFPCASFNENVSSAIAQKANIYQRKETNQVGVVRSAQGVRKAGYLLQELRKLDDKSSLGWGWGGGKQLKPGPRTAARSPGPTQRQPVELGTVLCDESDFWGKKNRMKYVECLVAVMKHERKEE